MTKRLHVINQLLGDEHQLVKTTVQLIPFCYSRVMKWNVSKSARDSQFSHLCRPAFLSQMLPIKSFTHIYSASSTKNTVGFLRRFHSQRCHLYKFKFSASVFWHSHAKYFTSFLLRGTQSNSSLTLLDERR